MSGGTGDNSRLHSETHAVVTPSAPSDSAVPLPMPTGPVASRPEVARQRPGSHDHVGNGGHAARCGVCAGRGQPGAGPTLICSFIRVCLLGCVPGEI